MLGKLGDLLNKDVGSLVKDAGKVLNTDVGTLAKGAGKVLNTDLTELLAAKEADAAAAQPAPEPEPAPAPPPTKPGRTPPPSRAPAAAAPTPAPAPPKPAFDPDATMKLEGSDATVVLAPVGDDSELPRLDDALMARGTRKMPEGTSLLELLPHSVGEFERPKATPTGELTADPVTAIYSSQGHPVAVRLVSCWDEDEAHDQLNSIKTAAGKNFRMGPDGSWILGETLQGLAFGWTRGNYSFIATAPKGEISMVRFLRAFPY